MAELHISDELNAELERAAVLLGRTKNDIAEEAITARLLEEASAEHLASGTSFTEEDIAKLRRGLDQLNRGEGISMEEVDAKFARWRQEREGR
jgi:predicted transcriptional regulator